MLRILQVQSNLVEQSVLLSLSVNLRIIVDFEDSLAFVVSSKVLNFTDWAQELNFEENSGFMALSVSLHFTVIIQVDFEVMLEAFNQSYQLISSVKHSSYLEAKTQGWHQVSFNPYLSFEED